ncbi:hypothetical protein GCM10028801_19540 [Nocardioides maradonensis]
MTSNVLLDEGDDSRWVDRARPVGLPGGREVPAADDGPVVTWSAIDPGTPRQRRFRPLRRWPTIVTVLVGAWLLAGAFLSVHPPMYTSATTVFLMPVSGNALSPSSATSSQQLIVAMETEARLVQSPAVAALAARIGGANVASLGPTLGATVPANTQIVRIELAARSADEAQLGVRAFATAFLEYRAAQARDAEQRQLSSLRAQSTSAQQQLQLAIRESNSAHPAPGATTRVQLYTSRLAAISDSIGQIESVDVNPGSVVMPASAPQMTLKSNRWVIGAGATVTGILLGLLVAFGRERLDARVRTSRDATVGGLRMWSRTPIPRRGDAFLDELDADDTARAAFRRARAGLLQVAPSPGVLAVTRDAAVPSVIGTALDLGLSLSDAGLSVVLVDASLEADGLTGIVPPDAIGLSEHLVGGRGQQLRLQSWRGIRVLSAGEDLAAAPDLLAHARMADLVQRLRASADYVLLVGPVAASTEAVRLGALADATVLVVADGVSTHRNVREIAVLHGEYGSRLAGAILLARTPRTARFRRMLSTFRATRRSRRALRFENRETGHATAKARSEGRR